MSTKPESSSFERSFLHACGRQSTRDCKSRISAQCAVRRHTDIFQDVAIAQMVYNSVHKQEGGVAVLMSAKAIKRRNINSKGALLCLRNLSKHR
jgi:hypothetical protein